MYLQKQSFGRIPQIPYYWILKRLFLSPTPLLTTSTQFCFHRRNAPQSQNFRVRTHHLKCVLRSQSPIKVSSMSIWWIAAFLTLLFCSPHLHGPKFASVHRPGSGSLTQQRKMWLMSYLLIQKPSARKIFHQELLTQKGRGQGTEVSFNENFSPSFFLKLPPRYPESTHNFQPQP